MRNSEKKHIVFAGIRNAGKSSLVNAFLEQDLSIVSRTPGTTTDPVKKTMELAPFGPVLLVDTAGIDDIGELGNLRIGKTVKAVSSADFVVFVCNAENEILTESETEFIEHLVKAGVNFACVINKSDLGVNPNLVNQLKHLSDNVFEVSCKSGKGIYELKESIARVIPHEMEQPLVGDLVKQGDIIILVVPVDLGAPKGRLIMPQVQTIREALDEDAVVIVTKDKELRSTLSRLNEKPKLVVTDSQAVMRVAADVPDDIPLTTFSILMARYKGDLDTFVKALDVIEKLESGDKVLIAEACSHHVQEDDIGTVKIPRWLKSFTRKEIHFDVAHGGDYPQNLSDYKLIIHCGGCTLTRKAMQTRIKEAEFYNVPIINYGVIISYLQGAFPRALEPVRV